MVRIQQQRVFRMVVKSYSASYPLFKTTPDEKIINAALPWGVTQADKNMLSTAIVPSKLEQISGQKIPSHIIGSNWGWLYVSESVREIIENLEGDIHAFTDEVKVFNKEGDRIERRYYGLAWGGDLYGTIIVEKSAWRDKITKSYPMEKGFTVPIRTGALTGAVTIDKNVIAGRHMWRAPDYTNKRDWFCSGELMAAFRKLRVSGLDIYEQILDEREGS